MKREELINSIKEMEKIIYSKGAIVKNLYAKKEIIYRRTNNIGYTKQGHLTHSKYLKVEELNKLYEFTKNFIENEL